jgi:quercetin dioxygenase-like cupin family protein
MIKRRSPVFRYHREIPGKEIAEGVTLQVLGASENMNVIHWDIEDGATVPRQQHPEEQFGYVIKGGFDVDIGGETAVLKAGDSYFIPANVPHSFRALGMTEAIDVFSPKRDVLGSHQGASGKNHQEGGVICPES